MVDDRRRFAETEQALRDRLHRRPTVSELAIELDWDEEHVTAVLREPSPSEVPISGARGSESGEIARLRGGTPVFPDAPRVHDDRPERRVQLLYDRDAHRLQGTAGGQPVELDLVRRRNVSGHIGSHDLEASWTSGNNYVPRPGGWTPTPDFVSDFPNIPADLTGSLDGRPVELHGVFHLDPEYRFERGSVAGRIGIVHLEATALAASGGLSYPRTVVLEGTFGSTPFEIYASIDAGLTRGIVHGHVNGNEVNLDVSRSSPITNISGTYQGPVELLTLVIGAVVQFL